MKKKLISLMLAVGMIAVVPTSVYASYSDDDYSYVSEFEGGTADTELEYFQSSSYLVKIPLRISNLVENGYSFTAQSINILDNEVVRVYAENTSVEMTNERGDTCTLNLSSDGTNGEMASFRNGETSSAIRMNGQMEMGARAGSYSGKATFSVRLETLRQ
ncbi:hypothetical protein [Blautia obeum]|uniref:hypothetical protein n=1 Tax=Blautia obeum TaxID=40520 RepID=UPI00356924BB